jgi:F-type H+-transporting ATPase subunit gamma
MTNAKEIRHQIKSIQSTQKITHAMEMVAASKMRKAQDRMRFSRPYFHRVKEVIAHLLQSRLEYMHPYLIERPVKKVAYLVISSDRGLCGGLNNILFKKVIKELMVWDEKGVSAEICTVGRKAEGFFNRQNAKLIASITSLGDAPKVKDLVGIIKVLSDGFVNGEVDQVFIAYNEFASAISQSPKIEALLPIIGQPHNSRDPYWDYIYEPAPEVLLDILLRRYIESLVYQGAVENIACEQAARMVAMKNATDNAGDLIEDFKLIYNKARQAAITKELAEIVAGAAAV